MSSSRQVSWLSRLSVSVLLAACTESVESPPLQPCPEGQDVEVRVSADPLPVFSWLPVCGLASLQVWDENSTSGWVLYTGDRVAENPLRPGIPYGNAPPEAIEAAPATPLTSSEVYTVAVYRWIGDPGGPGSLFEAGYTTFQR